jgi:ABC-type antimicrobial peptide transport system permease subunit
VSAAGMRARSDVRSRPVSLVLVTILVGVMGAVAITALAAARRTDSAYARYRAAANEPEAIVLGCPNGFPAPNLDLGSVERLPEVSSFAPMFFSLTNVADTQGRPLIYRAQDLSVNVSAAQDATSPAGGSPKLLAGRYPTGPDEVAIGWGQTDAPRPAIGDTIDIQMVPNSAIGKDGVPEPNALVHVPATVVGEVILSGELSGDQGSILASSSFFPAHPDVWRCNGGVFQLKGDLAGVTSFLARVYAIEPGAVAVDTSLEAIYVSRTTHLDAIILRLLAALAALAGVMVLGQSLVRRTSLGSIDTPILRALGMKRREIVWAAALPAFIVATGGALIAAAGAIVASAFFPTGLPRIVDPDPGVRVDAFAIGLGVALIVLTTLLSVILPARWLASARGGVEGNVEYQGAERRSVIASAIARLPLPPSAGAGARLALEPGHGRSATPVRSAVVGLSLAVASMVAAFGFAAGMDHFAATPRLWGLNFDFGTGQPFLGSAFEETAIPVLRDDEHVQDLVGGNFQQNLALRGPGGATQEAVWGLEKIKGHQVTTTMLEGRWPAAPDEIGLGRETLSTLGVRVGDTVTATVAGTTRELTVVGIPVFPDFGFGPGLGRGVAMTMDGLRVFYPAVTDNLVAGNFEPGTDRAAVIARWNKEVLDGLDAGMRVGGLEDLGATVRGTVRSRALPLQLSVLFAVAAFATLVHVLLTSVRRRRRDLAILQALGFRRRQVAATIAWQALTLAGLALVIGVPIGILAGRLGWAAFAYRLGVVSEPVISPLSIVVVPVTLVVAVVVSLGPGLAARRVRPAAVLKAE